MMVCNTDPLHANSMLNQFRFGRTIMIFSCPGTYFRSNHIRVLQTRRVRHTHTPSRRKSSYLVAQQLPMVVTPSSEPPGWLGTGTERASVLIAAMLANLKPGSSAKRVAQSAKGLRDGASTTFASIRLTCYFPTSRQPPPIWIDAMVPRQADGSKSRCENAGITPAQISFEAGVPTKPSHARPLRYVTSERNTRTGILLYEGVPLSLSM